MEARMNLRSIPTALAALAALALAASAAEARSLKWARTGDALTLDPHAQNESPTHNLAHQMYEPLLIRDAAGNVHPALAVSWKVTADPAVWEFKLRQGVKFHNGNPFTADDVVFSLDRARQPTSDMKGVLTSIESVSRVDDHTVHIKTKGPNPLLPSYLNNLFIMDKEWSEANNTVTVQDYKAKKDNFAVRNANGTGPYVLVSREQDVRTVLKRNEDYWGKGQVPLGITDITYLVIKSDPTRVAALLSGDVDFVQEVPVQDIDRLEKSPSLKINLGPENRTIFFGMNVGSAELASSNVKGKNPFADKRVRHAINMAIDREAIKRAVMRGQSVPAGIIAPPFVNGYSKELDAVPKVDLAKATALLKDAGYPDGFQVTLHCPNDRYINDEAICQAGSAMLAKIGIKVNLVSQPKGPHFTLIQKSPPETDFFLLGWGVPTYDSHYIFSFLYHTRSGSEGSWNATGFTNTEIDAAIRSLSSEVDRAKRDATIATIWKELAEETTYVALHHQMLAYAMKRDLDIPVATDNTVHMKFVAAK
jgi:peptide/nickel transport system substrate-binding protein